MYKSLGSVSPIPGWEKTFYFVGGDAFNQKFRPKQRESDATKSLKNSGNLALNGWFTN